MTDIAEYGKATRFKSGSKAVESGRKGGIKTQKANRQRKQTRELLLDMMTSVPNLDAKTIGNLQSLGIPADEQGKYTIEMIAGAAILQKAMRGDVRAYDTVITMIGERPAEKVEVHQPDFTELDKVLEALKK